MPFAAHESIVYGPLHTRGIGRSLGINLLPTGLRICNLNCAYCRYGWMHAAEHPDRHNRPWPAPTDVEAAVVARLSRAEIEGELIDRLTVAGHGESTLHPEFEAITTRLISVRDRIAPRVRLAIVSNSTTASWPSVRRALARFDERHMKLDAGDPFTYAQLCGSGSTVADILDGLVGLPPIVVHAMFVADPERHLDNVGEGAVSDWVAALETLRPLRVRVGTIADATTAPPLRPVAMRRLREIVEHVRAAGIHAELA